MFQMIGQRTLTSRGKMIAALNEANFAPSVPQASAASCCLQEDEMRKHRMALGLPAPHV
jgi:hypothetical protein